MPSLRTLALAGAALAGAACAPRRAPIAATPVSVAIPPRGETSAAPPREDPGPEALVWTQDGDGRPTTSWIAPAPAGVREIGQESGVFVAVGADAWRFRESEERVPTSPCQDGQGPPGEGKGTRAVVERLGSRDRVAIVTPPEEPGMNEVEHSVSLDGSVGPYLFLRESVYTYACGAHGGVSVSQIVWDLAARKRIALLAPDEQKALDAAERHEAQTKLPPFADPLTLEDVSYQGALPRYGAHGWLAVEHAFSTFACYACSDGAWGSYTVSLNVPARRLPERTRAYARPVPIVTSWLEAHPGVHLVGWSIVSPEAARALAPAFATQPGARGDSGAR